MALGAIDEFSFAPIKKASPEKLYVLNANPIINQWNYTVGFNVKRLLNNGYVNFSISRNAFDNDIVQYEDNQLKLAAQKTLSYQSTETENKIRLNVNKYINGYKIAYGVSAQLAEYRNQTFAVIRKLLKDSAGNTLQPGYNINFNSPLKNFWRYGAYVQVSKRVMGNRMGLSAGIRSDMNSFTNSGSDGLQTLSPRLSFSYLLTDGWTLNAAIGRYYKLPSYTILGFAENNAQLNNKNSQYQRSDHYTAGIEFLPNDGFRLTAEGFYKAYAQVPVSVRKGISLANLGNDFSVLGNEAISTNGQGKAFGFELFAQKKLTNRFFGILSYTFYRSKYSGTNQQMLPSSWDNQHLLSITWGYKLLRNWELGLKFRYQGAAPYTPYDEPASRANYLSQGKGIFDDTRLNSLRLKPFHSSDIRIDKKWNLKKTTIDLFLDITNWYLSGNQPIPVYTFKRNADNTAFVSTNGKPVSPDGANAIPILLKNDDPSFTPTIGFIIEF